MKALQKYPDLDVKLFMNGASEVVPLDFAQDFVLKEAKRAYDDLILSALKKHLPEVNVRNIWHFANRVTVVVPENDSDLSYFFLDRGTDREVCFLKLGKQELKIEDGQPEIITPFIIPNETV